MQHEEPGVVRDACLLLKGIGYLHGLHDKTNIWPLDVSAHGKVFGNARQGGRRNRDGVSPQQTTGVEPQRAAGAVDKRASGKTRIQSEVRSYELIDPCARDMPLTHKPADDAGTGDDISAT